MTERPIPFNAWKVRAILDGASQTSRPVKPQPKYLPDPIPCEWYAPTIIRCGEKVPGKEVYGTYHDDEGWESPFGAPGDLLVPLATWATSPIYNDTRPMDIPGDETLYTAWDGENWCPDSSKRRPGRSMPKRFRFVLPRLLVKRVWVESANPFVWCCEFEVKT